MGLAGLNPLNEMYTWKKTTKWRATWKNEKDDEMREMLKGDDS